MALILHQWDSTHVRLSTEYPVSAKTIERISQLTGFYVEADPNRLLNLVTIRFEPNDPKLDDFVEAFGPITKIIERQPEPAVKAP